MPFLLGLPIATLLAFFGARHWMLHRASPRAHHEPFDGTIHAVGRAAVAERRSDGAVATVIAMHGFVEDMRYFTRHYQDPRVQLLLMTSADYHVPFGDGRPDPAPWAKAPSAAPWTIRYDAEVLVQVLEHLPKTENVRVHGHSRGGAVVLEAASMRPDLFANVEVVLEAPVLPGGRVYREQSPTVRALFPFLVPLWKREPISDQNRSAYGALDDARKRQILEGLPFNPKDTAVMVANIADLQAWMAERDASLFQNVRGVVLAPGNDKVLDVSAMRASARQAGDRLAIVELPECSHFVVFDRPDAVPPLPRAQRPD